MIWLIINLFSNFGWRFTIYIRYGGIKPTRIVIVTALAALVVYNVAIYILFLCDIQYKLIWVFGILFLETVKCAFVFFYVLSETWSFWNKFKSMMLDCMMLFMVYVDVPLRRLFEKVFFVCFWMEFFCVYRFLVYLREKIERTRNKPKFQYSTVWFLPWSFLCSCSFIIQSEKFWISSLFSVSKRRPRFSISKALNNGRKYLGNSKISRARLLIGTIHACTFFFGTYG